jgi:diguanylate cyclase (GGDEF)-like protein
MTTRLLEELRKPREDSGLEIPAFLEAAFDHSPLAALVIDGQGRLVRWNIKAGDTLLPFFGRNESILFRELFSSGDDYEFLLFSLTRRASSVARELFLKTPDGQNAPYLVTVQSLQDDPQASSALLCYAAELKEVREAQNTVAEIQSRLEAEIEERQQTEGALQQTTAKLQEMVYEYGHRNRVATILSEMSEFLQACQSLEEAYPLVARFAGELFPETSGTLFMLDAQEEALEMWHSWGQPLLKVQTFPPQDCWAVRRGKLHQVLEKDPVMGCRHMREADGFSYLCAPLINQGQTIGLLHIQQKLEETGPLPDEFLAAPPDLPDEKLVSTFTDHIALTLSNQRLTHKLHHLAIRDPLTGLYNRRYLEESLDREIQRAKRKDSSLGVLMLDIDYFKKFNDAHGHEPGDLLLKMLGAFLKTSIRVDDTPCRYGGEEFTLILPEITLENACLRAETIRQGAALLQVNYQGTLLDPVTFSIGVAIFPQDGATGEALLRRADKALYLAKELGRNRVMTARDLP